MTEPSRDAPVLAEADIVVVGTGTTGPIAAIAGARRGKRIVLIERFGSLGGSLALGLDIKPSGALIGGMSLEI
ncbi:MAG: FAD-dependent oxidoreductase [Proteobacteria bacterium]|nr:FAD-dependent oxidoreductase [Pseudomonadota bacterium]